MKKNTGLLIRIDDVADHMNWNYMKKTEALFDKLNIKPLLGVIPSNKDQEIFKYEKKENFWNQVRNWQDKGWEIAMHGFSHLYDKETHKKDYFEYGGKSEFFGHSFEEQRKRIQNGLDIFKKNNIKIRSFFAPNHTYDENTFTALKDLGINQVVDGYGFFPYTSNEIKFIPQLFYKLYCLPYGIQSTQIHLNYWKDKDFDEFKKFIDKNQDNIIDYDYALSKVNDNKIMIFANNIIEKILKTKRKFY